MNISGINLNLIPILKVLLEERNTTETARKLYLTQPQVSRALQMLKAQFNDELLIRGKSPKRMELTAKAREIELEVSQLTSKMKAVLDKWTRFEPHKMKKSFRIGTGEMTTGMILPEFIKVIDSVAPEASVTVLCLEDLFSEKFSSIKEVDILIANEDPHFLTFRYELLLSCENVCVISKTNAEKNKNLSPAEILKFFTHLSVAPFRQEKIVSTNRDILYHSVYQKYPDAVTMKMPYLEAVDVLRKGDNCLMLMSKIIAEKLSFAHELTIMQIPFEVPLCKFYMFWDDSRENEPEHKWLRERIKEIFNRLRYGII